MLQFLPAHMLLVEDVPGLHDITSIAAANLLNPDSTSEKMIMISGTIQGSMEIRGHCRV